MKTRNQDVRARQVGQTCRKVARIGCAATLVLLMPGCDERLARLARESANRQAEQNAEMIRLNREVAAGTRHLVTSDAQNRSAAVDLQSQIQRERSELAAGWNALESARSEIARKRLTDSAFRYLVQFGGPLLLAGLTIAFAWVALTSAREDQASADSLCEALITHCIADPPSANRPAGDSLPILPITASSEQPACLPPTRETQATPR